MKRLHLRLIGCAIIALGFSKLDGGPAVSPSERIEFTVVQGDGKPPAGAFILGRDGTEIPLSINSATRSPVYTYAGAQPIAIWGRSAAGEQRTPVAAVSFPAGAHRVLLVLLTNPAFKPGGPSHVGVAIDDAWETANVGSLKFLNFTGKKISAQLKGEVLDLAPGPSKPFKVAEPKAALLAFQLRLAQPEEAEFRMFYDGSMKASGDERLTALLLPPAVAGGLSRVRVLRETLPQSSSLSAKKG